MKATNEKLIDFLVQTSSIYVNNWNQNQLVALRDELNISGTSVDIVKYMIPEAYKTSLVWTINMRSLRNFIALRSNKSALWEIRELANEIYRQLPTTHKFMFVEKLDKEAVEKILGSNKISLLHGPPGTGKTQACAEIICQTFKQDTSIKVVAFKSFCCFFALVKLIIGLRFSRKIFPACLNVSMFKC